MTEKLARTQAARGTLPLVVVALEPELQPGQLELRPVPRMTMKPPRLSTTTPGVMRRQPR